MTGPPLEEDEDDALGAPPTGASVGATAAQGPGEFQFGPSEAEEAGGQPAMAAAE